MALTRRELLTAIAAAGVGGAPRRTAAQAGRSDALPWASLRRQLQASYHDLRRHFVFEYYPWYANTPFRHWQQWGRVPPADLAGTSMPLLGAYDSRSVAVIEQHARWIADAGVGVVDLSWWGVGSFSDAAVSVVMDVMRAHDIEVTFHLEPYRADRVEHLAADVQYLLREYGEKRRWDGFYLNHRADGRQAPVFKLFATTLPSHQIDCHGVRQKLAGFAEDDRWRWSTDRVRRELASTFPDVLLLSGDTRNPTRVAAAGFDGFANYDPTLTRSRWLDAALEASRLGLLFSFNVNPGFDLIERRDVAPDECYRPTPFVPTTRPLDWSLAQDREWAARLADLRIVETFGFLTQMYARFWVVEGPPCSGRGSGCRSWRS